MELNVKIHVEIPALDRLCAVLEKRPGTVCLGAEMAQGLAQETTSSVGAFGAATFPRGEGSQMETETEAEAPVTAAEAETGETSSDLAARGHLPQGGRLLEPVPEPVPEPAPEPEPKPPVTLGAVQRAAAALRDAGRLADVKALFPEFGIRKLSDLEGAQLDAFAEKLRGMGVKL